MVTFLHLKPHSPCYIGFFSHSSLSDAYRITGSKSMLNLANLQFQALVRQKNIRISCNLEILTGTSVDLIRLYTGSITREDHGNSSRSTHVIYRRNRQTEGYLWKKRSAARAGISGSTTSGSGGAIARRTAAIASIPGLKAARRIPRPAARLRKRRRRR